MGSQSSKCSEGSPPSGNLASFMLKNYVLPTGSFLTKQAKQTKSNPELQWPLWGTFDLPKHVFLKIKLEDHGSKIK